MSDPAFVEVYAAADTLQAHFLKNLLQDSGIEARVMGESLRAVAGGVPPGQATAPQLSVPKADGARARRLIEAWEASRRARSTNDDDASTWPCPSCGQLVEASFSTCWKCGTATESDTSMHFTPLNPRSWISARIVGLSAIISAITAAACYVVGASVPQLLLYVLLANVFSACVGWCVTQNMPSADGANDDSVSPPA